MEDNFLEELKQDIKNEHLMKMFHKYFPHVLVFAAILIFITIAYVLYTNYQNKQYGILTDKLAQVTMFDQNSIKNDQKDSAFKLLMDKKGYAQRDFLIYYGINTKFLDSNKDYNISNQIIHDLIAIKSNSQEKLKILHLLMDELQVTHWIANKEIDKAEKLLVNLQKSKMLPLSMHERFEKYKQYIELKK